VAAYDSRSRIAHGLNFEKFHTRKNLFPETGARGSRNSRNGDAVTSASTDGKKLKTVEGEGLTVRKSGDSVMIVDAKGGSATVTIPNVNQSNGVIHVVDTVLMPAS
jgi:uncharacterized surface protein with fasciclin (FAS1) repeats